MINFKKSLGLVAVSVSGMLAISSFLSNEINYSPRKFPFFAGTNSPMSIKFAVEHYQKMRVNEQTGEIKLSDILKAKEQAEKLTVVSRSSNTNLQWEEMGPDNVGGRTRAFIIDKNNPSKFFAGGVAGGIFVSTDAGGNWSPVTDNLGNLNVSSLTQAANGDIYFGTGEIFAGNSGINYSTPGFVGGGIYKSTDGGQSFTLLESTKPANANNTSGEWSFVNDVVAHPTDANIIYAGTNRGLRVSTDGGLTWISNYIIAPNGNGIVGNCRDVEVNNDGTVAVSLVNNVYISPNGQPGSFVNSSSNGIPTGGSFSRLELAIAPSNSNVIYACGAAPDGTLQGVYITKDKGASWTRIGQRTTSVGGGAPLFDPFASGLGGGQGDYDNILCVHPTKPYELYLGGIDMYRWRINGNSTDVTQGFWNTISAGFPSNTLINPRYVHSDCHIIVFHPTNHNQFFVGTDGGMFRGNIIGDIVTYNEINRGYNVTQFYEIDHTGFGGVLGGTQDNGSPYITIFGQNTTRSAVKVTGGDGGGSCASKLNRRIIFTTVYFGQIRRSEDDGRNFSDIVSGALSTLYGANGFANASFVTPIELWESRNDLLSKDSVWFYNRTTETITSGSTVDIISKTNSIKFPYILNANLLPNDSIKVKDIIQSKFVTGYNGSVWLTRRALDFSADPSWIRIANITGTAQHIVFSNDGNTVFVGTQGGIVYRITNLSDLNDNDKTPTTTPNLVSPKVNVQQIASFGRSLNGLAVHPQDPNKVAAVLGGYGSTVYVQYSSNAMSASPTFAGRQGTGATKLPEMPIYSAIFERNSDNLLILGTEFGIYSTDNINQTNPTWVAQNNGIPSVPVFSLKQQTMTNNWENVIWNEGVIYAGTHSRGVYKTNAFAAPTVSINENKVNVTNQTALRVFPNPVRNNANIQVELSSKLNDAVISIYDLKGSVVKTMKLNQLNEGNNLQQIPVNGLNKGMYIIQLTGSGINVSTRMLIAE